MNKTEVIRQIGKENWESFCKFMRGQTVGITPDGKIDYYKRDVDNFKAKLQNKPIFFD